MNYILRYSTKAESEYFKAFDYYEEQSEGLGDRFEESVNYKIDKIIKNPYQYAERRPNYRECWVKDFPFLIVYKILVHKQIILITSIFHTSRNPRKKFLK